MRRKAMEDEQLLNEEQLQLMAQKSNSPLELL